jgi:hypothetical protein
MRRCNRFRRDGSACTNQTDNADGWCRKPNCPGFTQSDPPPPLTPGPAAPDASVRQIPETQHLTPGDFTIDDVGDIDVSRRAIDQFRSRHGGGVREAELQLRNMLEDFVVLSAPWKSRNGRLVVTWRGYSLVLTPTGDEINSYSTNHRERTWEQVKTGVPSRVSAKSRRGPSGSLPEQGHNVELADFPAAFNPATVHLTALARIRYEKIAALESASDEELDTAIRAALTESNPGNVTRLDNACFEIAAANRIWIVSPDCQMIRTVKNATPEDPPAAVAHPTTERL